MSKTPEYLALGKLGRTKGLKGELFFNAYNPESDLLETLTSVRVGDAMLHLESVHHQAKRDVVRFSEIRSIDDAKGLTGCEVLVRRSDLPELPSGQHYVDDLVGMKVVDEEDHEIGVLMNVIPTASNDIFVVKGAKGEVLLPALKDVVKTIDTAERRMVVCPPETVDAF